ncbi:hypothetical protein [Pedobacter antarcticus]|uniref:hypothetical protein n=1 Tax=Pedobacter antarcticus TaxID=34086 RepID=UPI00293122BE|nr:hypothetical protein [Pedobacter antarcticus]
MFIDQGNDLHNEDIHEIITAVPSWILRWGITLIFIFIAAFFLLSALIQYPDIIKAELKVHSLNAPKIVLSKDGGKLSEL